MDHARVHQESRLRDDGDDRHRGARDLFVQPAARRAIAGRDPSLRARADHLPGRESRGCRDRRDQAARIRDQHGLRREPDPLEFEGGSQRGLRRVPHVDRHVEGDAGRARQDRAGASELSPRRQGAARHPRRPGEPAAGGDARRAVADDEPARPHVAHRPDHRQGAGERSRCRAHRRQRADDAPDSHPDQAQRGVGARHRRRPGDQRRSRLEPGRSRGPHHARTVRLDRPRRGQDQGPGAIRADRRRAAGRRARLPVAGRRRDRRGEGAGLDLPDQRPSVDRPRHPEAAGREHRRHRPRRPRGDRGAEEADPRRTSSCGW